MEKLTLTEVAKAIQEKHPGLHPKAWEKGTHKRIYIDAGFLTKKASTTSYIDIKGKEAYIYVRVECPTQTRNWCSSQEDQITQRESVQEALAITKELYDFPDVEITEAAVTDSGTLEGLDTTEIAGYYTEWRKARVKINSYGKLATVNRQYVILWRGIKTDAPKTFTALSEDAYVFAERLHGKEVMLDPYQLPNDYEAMVAAQKANDN